MICCNNVSYAYNTTEHPTVQNLNFRVLPGEMVLFTGHSGCGKSTIVRLLNGLCPQYYRGSLKGDILIGGLSTKTASLAELARTVGTLWQDPEQQFFTLTVEEEIIFALTIEGVDASTIEKRKNDIVTLLRLDTILNAKLEGLSEGEKQKVALASLLVRNPKVLVLDEPTANLDPASTIELAHILCSLKSQGLSIIIVDHRLYWLHTVVDTVYIMSKGHIVEQGSFALLEDTSVQNTYGLRKAHVTDVRTQFPAATKQQSLCTAENITFAYKNKRPIFSNRSWNIGKGITAVIGANGAGKTTFAKMLTGLLEPTQGTICIHDIPYNAKDRIKKIHLVLQNTDHQLYMKTVEEEILSSLYYRKDIQNKYAIISELLEQLHLSHLAKRHPQSLSGGEKQRLVLACSFAKFPEILILDEPTSGLDGSNMQRIATMLQQYAQQEKSIITITHDLELMETSCQYSINI